MYSLLIALLGVGGAWSAWRRNPFYTAPSRVRLIGVATVAAAAAVLAALVIVSRLTHRAEPALATTFLTVVILAALGLQGVLQAVVLPHAAHLTTRVPPGAQWVRLHRQRVVARIRRLLIAVGLCAALAIFSSGMPRSIALWCGAMLAISAAIASPLMYANARRIDASLTALARDPWVHWRYSAEEWRRWAALERERRSGERVAPPRGRLSRLLVALAALGTLGWLAFTRGPIAARIDFSLLLLAGLVLAALAAGRRERSVGASLDGTPVKGREAYLGNDGVFIDGAYTLWRGASVYLVSAGIDAREPRSLLFNFEKIVLNPYGPNRVRPLHQCLPIPPGCEAEIAHLERELKTRCPKARIALSV